MTLDRFEPQPDPHLAGEVGGPDPGGQDQFARPEVAERAPDLAHGPAGDLDVERLGVRVDLDTQVRQHLGMDGPRYHQQPMRNMSLNSKTPACRR